jgi:hypothetical protein
VGQRIGGRTRGAQAGDEETLTDELGEHVLHHRPVGAAEGLDQLVGQDAELHGRGCPVLNRMDGPRVPDTHPVRTVRRFEPPATQDGEIGESHVEALQQLGTCLQAIDDIGKPLLVSANDRPMISAPPHLGRAVQGYRGHPREQTERGGATGGAQDVAGGGHGGAADLLGLHDVPGADCVHPPGESGTGLPDGIGEFWSGPHLVQPRATSVRIARIGPPVGGIGQRRDR